MNSDIETMSNAGLLRETHQQVYVQPTGSGLAVRVAGRSRGLNELGRVSRERIEIVTSDPRYIAVSKLFSHEHF